MAIEIAAQLAERLSERQLRVVFAESCTGGLVSAEMARVPGISEWLCGSAVTYRCATKSEWLDVSSADMESHTAVSEIVASQMAEGVLAKTSEAGLAISITGHLGPNAPQGFDGLVFVGVARLAPEGGADVHVQRHILKETSRIERQSEAALLVIQAALSALEVA